MTIKVQFIGICTHHHELGPSPQHRVVLVRADNGAYLNGNCIAPHIPKLRIDPKHVDRIEGFPYGLEPMGEAGLWRIRGVLFELEGAVGSSVVRDPSFSDVPRLQTDSARPNASHEVIHREEAACYFDLTAGTIKTIDTGHDAIATEVTVETDADPALRVTCFWNRAVSRFRLKQDAVVTIEHTGYQLGDLDADFLLHFRILETVPADAKIPPEKKTQRNKVPGDISIGCSNSQYP
jgi:hypothetical protein